MTRVPEPVRASVASKPTNPGKLIVHALREELTSGEVGPDSLGTLAAIFATGAYGLDADDREALGGSACQWFTACSVAGVPDTSRIPGVDDWALRVQAQASPTIWTKTRVTGALRPRLLTDLAAEIEALDQRSHASVLAILEETIERTLRSIGLQVTAALKNPALKAEFRALNPTAVPEAALRREVRAGVTAMTVSGVDLERAVERAERALEERLTDSLETVQEDVRGAVGAALGILDGGPDLDIPGAVSTALGLFRTRLLSILRPDPIPGTDLLEVGERLTGRIGSGVVSTVFTEAARGRAGQGLGAWIGRVLRRSVESISPEAPGPAGEIGQQVQQQRARVSPELIWVHAKFGQPAEPFPPHRALDGIAVSSEEFGRLSAVDHEYSRADGSIGRTRPFSIEGWHPGDHAGCTCGYRMDITLEVI